MQKNWYVIYTKQGSEKKVATLLDKKKIEKFFPVNILKHNKPILKRREHCTPLFCSYVFVNITETDIPRLKKIEGVLGLIFWKGKPAVVPTQEIEAIREFISDYPTIHLEKTMVNPEESVRVVNGPQYAMEGNLLTIKTSSVKIKLPSIGYTLIAEIDDETRLGSGMSLGNKELLLQS